MFTRLRIRETITKRREGYEILDKRYDNAAGGGGTVAEPDAGMPVTGAIGLGVLAGAVAFGGAFVLRRKK